MIITKEAKQKHIDTVNKIMHALYLNTQTLAYFYHEKSISGYF